MIEHDEMVLAAQGVTKRFGGVKALDGAHLEVRAGQVTAVMGENGAGKSTLMKILSGVYQDHEGRILRNGREVVFANPRQAQEQGVTIIHQELNLIPNLTVAENLFLGREHRDRLGLIDVRRMRRESSAFLHRLDLDVDPSTQVSRLRVGQQQIVEIARALALKARVIIMDEPTSAISEREVDVLFGLIGALKREGVAIVYVSHKMDEVFRIADQITVMRDGRTIGSAPRTQLSHDEVVRMMVGRDLKEFFVQVQTEAARGSEVLRVEEIRLPHPDRPGDFLVKDVRFSVARGEVLGLFGLMGAGRSELLETIFGLHAKTSSGRVFLEGREVRIASCAEAIAAGLALVPEDRKRQGLVMDMSVAASISLASLAQVERFGFLSRRREQALAGDLGQRLSIRAASLRQPVKHLSGGNQQKVVIAKWLATRPRALLLDEPTRGIDVHAKNQIYQLIHELAAAGLAIVMVSSELPEILAIAHRILVLSEGRQTAEFSRGEATEESILKAALPGSLSGHRLPPSSGDVTV
ncbi:MAG: sugar ABC transporter ATP-binding protein [Phycisphaerae bacterium]|nr:sugar ABC transporter ATP-binding protein [Phycisphaerae bacterium]